MLDRANSQDITCVLNSFFRSLVLVSLHFLFLIESIVFKKKKKKKGRIRRRKIKGVSLVPILTVGDTNNRKFDVFKVSLEYLFLIQISLY